MSASTIAPFAIIVDVIDPLGSASVPVAVRLLIVGDENIPPDKVPDRVAPFIVGAVSVVEAKVPPDKVPNSVAPLITTAVRVLFVSVCVPLIVTKPFVGIVRFNALIM